jgi:hypothetical protein
MDPDPTRANEVSRVAVCPSCRQEMTMGVSCSPEPVVIRGVPHEPVRWGEEPYLRRDRPDLTTPCGDCSTVPGGVHHHWCCVERCPACLGQLISCTCTMVGLCLHLRTARGRGTLRGRRSRRHHY